MARVEVWDDGPTGRVPIGRVSWSEASFRKWCEPKKAPKGRYFVFFDVVRPPWPQCRKQREPPDVYFKLERMLRKDAWTHVMLLALRDGVDAPSPIATARELASSGVSAVSLHRVVGPFAEPGRKHGRGGEGMSHALMDWTSHAPSAKTWKSRKVRL